MKTLHFVIAQMVILGCSAHLALFAQAPPQPPSPADHAQREVKHFTTLLSLTPAQQEQATAIFTDAATAEENVHKVERSAHELLRSAVKIDSVSAIEQASNTIGQTTTTLVAIHAKADAAFYQLLNPEQQNKLSELQAERPGPPPFVPPDGMRDRF
jgi:Spy/CpxP family protein refolding chaperone